jgi:hypothetical protein
VFQAIENGGQYTQPPMTTKARWATGKTGFMLHIRQRWSDKGRNIRRRWRICPKMRVFIIFEQP